MHRDFPDREQQQCFNV